MKSKLAIITAVKFFLLFCFFIGFSQHIYAQDTKIAKGIIASSIKQTINEEVIVKFKLDTQPKDIFSFSESNKKIRQEFEKAVKAKKKVKVYYRINKEFVIVEKIVIE